MTSFESRDQPDDFFTFQVARWGDYNPEGIDDPAITAPEAESTVQTEPELPPLDEQTLDSLRNFVAAINDAQVNAGGGLFAAEFRGELSENGALTDFEPAPDDPSLAAYDRPETEKGKLEIDQAIIREQYKQVQEVTGIALGGDAFVPYAQIVDGRRFANTLASISEGDDTLSNAMLQTVVFALYDIRAGFIPSLPEEDGGSSLTQPQMLAELQQDPGASAAHREIRAATLRYAREIADGMEQLGMDPNTVSELRHARLADEEGLLAEWAVLSYWNAFSPPDTALSAEWDKWHTKEDWKQFNQFVDNAVAKVGANSPFLQSAAKTWLDNIERRKNGDIVTFESELEAYNPELFDNDYIGFDDDEGKETPEMAAEWQKFKHKYDILLGAAQDKLRQLMRAPEA